MKTKIEILFDEIKQEYEIKEEELNNTLSKLEKHKKLHQGMLDALTQAEKERDTQLLGLAQYMCEHQNKLDGKTAKDYLNDFLTPKSEE